MGRFFFIFRVRFYVGKYIVRRGFLIVCRVELFSRLWGFVSGIFARYVLRISFEFVEVRLTFLVEGVAIFLIFFRYVE